MFSMIADVWNNIINSCIRELPSSIRGIIILVALLLTFWLISKSINLSKNHETKPIKFFPLILGILCFGVAILYSVF